LSVECTWSAAPTGISARVGSSARIGSSALIPSTQRSHPNVYIGTVKTRGSNWKPKPPFVWIIQSHCRSRRHTNKQMFSGVLRMGDREEPATWIQQTTWWNSQKQLT